MAVEIGARPDVAAAVGRRGLALDILRRRRADGVVGDDGKAAARRVGAGRPAERVTLLRRRPGADRVPRRGGLVAGVAGDLVRVAGLDRDDVAGRVVEDAGAVAERRRRRGQCSARRTSRLRPRLREGQAGVGRGLMEAVGESSYPQRK